MLASRAQFGIGLPVSEDAQPQDRFPDDLKNVARAHRDENENNNEDANQREREDDKFHKKKNN